ncbi:MAG: activating signal cointegrator 1 complex subunit, partial [Marteilia pararefringens]
YCCDLDKLLEVAYDAINNGEIDFQFEQYIFLIQGIDNADKQVSTKFFDSKYSDKEDYNYSKNLQWSQRLCSILDINYPADSKDCILKSNVSNELSNHLKNCLDDFCLRTNREYEEIRQTFDDIIKQKDIKLVEESLLNLFGYEEIEFISYIFENLDDIHKAMEAGPQHDKKLLNGRSDCGGLITDLPHVFDRRMQFPQNASIGNYCLPPDSIFSLDSTRRVQTLFIPASLDTSFKEQFSLKSVESLESEFLRNILCNISSLNVIQSILFETAYNTDENMLIAAPTGSGKTISAIICIAREIEKHLDEKGNLFDNKFKIIYIAPMKSLASEITATFCQMLKPLKALECTGDTLPSRKEIESSNIIVSTPEKWDIITRKSTGDTDLVSICKLLIIDEVHLLASDRGAVLESIVARLFIQIEKQQSKIRIVALSATLPNYIDIAKFLKIEMQKGLFVFDDRFRSTPLDLSIIGISQKRHTNYSPEDILFNQTMLDIIMDESKEDKQSLVFVHSRNQTEKTARFIIDEITKSAKSLIIRSDDTDVEQKKLSKESFHSNFLQTAVLYRIGIHHAGMSRHDRNIVERLFRNSNLLVNSFYFMAKKSYIQLIANSNV